VIAELAFLSPNRLLILLVIPLLVLAYILAMHRKNRRGMRFTNTSMLDVVVPKQSQWRRHLAVALSLLSLITLTAAFARPKTQVDVPRERATVVVVIDASLSMEATDVQPNRLAAAKQAAIDFVKSLPPKYNVAVVSLSGNPNVLVPPTIAHNTVENAINTITLQESTAIGEGIITAMRALEQAPKDPSNPKAIAPGAIVMLTDGTNTAGRSPQQAAAEAKNAKVPIYTIAYGTENGYVDLDGKREPVPVDHELMREIARISGGEYFAAATPDQLKKVYTNIGSEVGYEKADREVTARFAGYGLALAVLAALGAISLGAKWP
jgi:Ca-activated chloride channel family protein